MIDGRKLPNETELELRNDNPYTTAEEAPG